MRADDVLRASKLCRLAFVQILKRDGICLLFILALPWLSGRSSKSRRHPPAHPHHLRQEIVHIHAHGAGSIPSFEGLHAMGIVEMSRVIIGEDLVSFADGFEFDICLCAFILRDFVGVAGESGLEHIPESALAVTQVIF